MNRENKAVFKFLVKEVGEAPKSIIFTDTSPTGKVQALNSVLKGTTSMVYANHRDARFDDDIVMGFNKECTDKQPNIYDLVGSIALFRLNSAGEPVTLTKYELQSFTKILEQGMIYGKPLFEVGQITSTAAAHEVLGEDKAIALIHKHSHGDWGSLSDCDRQANNRAIEAGERIVSKYKIKQHSFYVITESDRTLTTILLAEEY